MLKKLQIENETTRIMLLILLAYIFSISVRMYWPIYFSDTISMYYNNQLMINTNDGYFFASGAKDILAGVTPEDSVRVSAFNYGLSQITAFLTEYSTFSLDTVILYMPAIIASLVVIPIILSLSLTGHTLLGFFSALIGSIAWSYYNRTMIGYYDSDMFSVFLQFSIFYSFLYIAYKKNMFGIFLASFLVIIFPYFYPQGISITYAMFGILIVYLLAEYKGFIKVTETNNFINNDMYIYKMIILISISMMSMIPEIWRIVIFIITLLILTKKEFTEKEYFSISIIIFFIFLYLGNGFNAMFGSLKLYLQRGVEEEVGLHFYQVIQTVREAGAIPFSTIADRISGSMLNLILSSIGYIILVFRHKPFIIALPLIGVGFFAYIGGLRFTVYAVPVAAIGVVYLFWVIADNLLKDNKVIKYSAVFIATIAVLYPNIQHVINYKTPTVLNSSEVSDLKKLDKISNRTDYTLTWWDYGFPIWYYSDTSTLIDGGKHQNDNYIIAKMMLSTSPELTANLGRLAVETYIDSNYSNVANTLFKKENLDSEELLISLSHSNYKLPKKSREVYIYLPYRMLNIFPTISLFGNLDLKTGKKERDIIFYPSSLKSKTNAGVLTLANGIIFDIKKGIVKLGKSNKAIRYFIITENSKDDTIKVQGQKYNDKSNLIMVFMKSYNKFILMDAETFNSSFVQMFILGKYDKNLFELVVASPYSRIYRIKK